MANVEPCPRDAERPPSISLMCIPLAEHHHDDTALAVRAWDMPPIHHPVVACHGLCVAAVWLIMCLAGSSSAFGQDIEQLKTLALENSVAST